MRMNKQLIHKMAGSSHYLVTSVHSFTWQDLSTHRPSSGQNGQGRFKFTLCVQVRWRQKKKKLKWSHSQFWVTDWNMDCRGMTSLLYHLQRQEVASERRKWSILKVSVVLCSLVPRPPPFFVLWFVFSIIHGSRRPAKNGKMGRPAGNEASVVLCSLAHKLSLSFCHMLTIFFAHYVTNAGEDLL